MMSVTEADIDDYIQELGIRLAHGQESLRARTRQTLERRTRAIEREKLDYARTLDLVSKCKLFRII